MRDQQIIAAAFSLLAVSFFFGAVATWYLAVVLTRFIRVVSEFGEPAVAQGMLDGAAEGIDATRDAIDAEYLQDDAGNIYERTTSDRVKPIPKPVPAKPHEAHCAGCERCAPPILVCACGHSQDRHAGRFQTDECRELACSCQDFAVSPA